MTHSVLASDGDREASAARLRNAAAEGRLEVVELEERLAAAYRARTQLELAQLTVDLPRQPAVSPPKARVRRATSAPERRRRLMTLGGTANAAILSLWMADVGPMRDPVIFGMTEFDLPWPLIPVAVWSGVAAAAAWRRRRSEEPARGLQDLMA